jgi:hypothetical protein
VLALVSALEPVVARISELTIEIRHALQAHPDGPTFRSLFIAPDSWLCAASMLAEIGDRRDRYPSYRTLAADAGQCPVAVEPGKFKDAQFRWACDHRLRDAFDTPPTQAVATTHGRPTSMTVPAPEAPATPTPVASSAARGARSSGASGKTTTPTIPPDTPHGDARSPPQPDIVGPHRGRPPRLTQRRPGAAFTAGCRRTERAALDGKPADATPQPPGT